MYRTYVKWTRHPTGGFLEAGVVTTAYTHRDAAKRCAEGLSLPSDATAILVVGYGSARVFEVRPTPPGMGYALVEL